MRFSRLRPPISVDFCLSIPSIAINVPVNELDNFRRLPVADAQRMILRPSTPGGAITHRGPNFLIQMSFILVGGIVTGNGRYRTPIAAPAPAAVLMGDETDSAARMGTASVGSKSSQSLRRPFQRNHAVHIEDGNHVFDIKECPGERSSCRRARRIRMSGAVAHRFSEDKLTAFVRVSSISLIFGISSHLFAYCYSPR